MEQHVPVPVAGLGTGSGLVAVDGGGSHSVALRSDGLVVTWGSDAFGQLGDDGEYANRSAPVPVSGLGWGSGVVAVAAGYGHNLALRADGSVMAWGFNSTGQLGVGGAGVDQPTPLAVNGLGAGSGVAAVAAGYGHSVALKRAKGATVDFDGNRTTDVAVYRPSTGVVGADPVRGGALG